MASYDRQVMSDFLHTPDLGIKPRSTGLTHVLDTGMNVPAMAGLLASYGVFVDFWKFGFGTSYLEPRLQDKIALLEEFAIQPCLGGTLLEIAWAQGSVNECLAWAADSGITVVEVSRGAVAMSREDKGSIIRKAAERFLVLAETGCKSAAHVLTPQEWRIEMSEDLADGAAFVVTEGRESGTVGLYDGNGRARTEIVDVAVEAAGQERIIFEAPRKDQQAWFIQRFGSEVNLGNISTSEILSLATLRTGLRADTIHLSTAHEHISS